MAVNWEGGKPLSATYDFFFTKLAVSANKRFLPWPYGVPFISIVHWLAAKKILAGNKDITIFHSFIYFVNVGKA